MTAAPGPHCSPDVVTFGETRAALRLGKVGAGGDAVMTPVNQSPPDAVTFGETRAALRLGKVAAGGDAVMTPVNQSPPDAVTFGETIAALRAHGALRFDKAAAGEEL